MSRFILPLVALSDLATISDISLPSLDHYQVTSTHNDTVWPWRHYKTSSHTPPDLNITRYGGELAPGYIFFSPADQHGVYGTYETSGTGLIMTDDGDLVFAAEADDYSSCTTFPSGMTNFRMQLYRGRRHITYWNGCNDPRAHWGHRWGRVTFMDEEYTSFTINPSLDVETLDESNDGQIDMHDQHMTADDTMVITSYNSTQLDLRHFGGATDTWASDSMFFEIDVATGATLFKWSALESVPDLMEKTVYPLAGGRGAQNNPWDWFHINSVQKVGKDYLISARHQSAVFFISGDDGHVIWKLHGGGGGDFGSIPLHFRWQHHATAHNVTDAGMVVSVFNNNNGGGQTEESQSTALAFYLPLPPDPFNPPREVRNLRGGDAGFAWAGTQGSYQMDIGNGNDFVGYGKVPLLREYDRQGYLRWQAWFGRGDSVMSYRAYKSEWHGTPKHWDPVAVFEPNKKYPKQPGNIYVSWNGATDISHWAVFAGEDRDDLFPIGVAERKGFETSFQPPADTGVDIQCVQLGAVRNGKIIRASNIACKTDALTPPSRLRIPLIQSGLSITYTSLFQASLALTSIFAAISTYKLCRRRRKRLASSASGLMASTADATLPRFSHARAPSWFSSHSRASSLFSHSRVPSGLSLRSFTPSSTKQKLSPMVGAEDGGVFEEVKVSGAEASKGRGRRSTLLGAGGAEEFGVVREEDGDVDDDGYDSSREESNARTPFIRRGTEWEK